MGNASKRQSLDPISKLVSAIWTLHLLPWTIVEFIVSIVMPGFRPFIRNKLDKDERGEIVGVYFIAYPDEWYRTHIFSAWMWAALLGFLGVPWIGLILYLVSIYVMIGVVQGTDLSFWPFMGMCLFFGLLGGMNYMLAEWKGINVVGEIVGFIGLGKVDIPWAASLLIGFAEFLGFMPGVLKAWFNKRYYRDYDEIHWYRFNRSVVRQPTIFRRESVEVEDHGEALTMRAADLLVRTADGMVRFENVQTGAWGNVGLACSTMVKKIQLGPSTATSDEAMAAEAAFVDDGGSDGGGNVDGTAEDFGDPAGDDGSDAPLGGKRA